MSVRFTTIVLVAAGLLGGLGCRAYAQTPTSPAAPATPARGQAVATVNAPVQLLGIPVAVTAANPVSYIGSAYQDDVSGQSESNADPAIAEDARRASPDLPDAW